MLNKLLSFFRNTKDTDPEHAYDRWAGSYDDQPDNLMLALDEEVFTALLKTAAVKDGNVVDVGCGTGRHWKKIIALQPAKLVGYDVSAGMLQILQHKFPGALTYQLKDQLLQETGSVSADMVVSTLTIAHIEDAAAALKEWDRIMRPGADIIITDYHPAILQKGGKRTFKQDGKTVSVKNHIHTIEVIKKIASELNWQIQELIEKKVDESLKHFYEKQNALHVFESFKGLPVIYGIHFKKSHGH